MAEISPEELEKLKEGWLKEYSNALRVSGIEGELQGIKKRLDISNGLKETMVTKEEFAAFTLTLNRKVDNFLEAAKTRFVTFEDIDRLTKEQINKHGLLGGLTQVDFSAVKNLIKKEIKQEEQEENHKAWFQTWKGRLTLLSAIVAAAAFVFQDIVLYLHQK